MSNNLFQQSNKKFLKNIFKNVNKRYDDRFKKFGDDPKSLGWDNTTNQNIRFKTAFENLNFKDKSILDVGCGLANFYDFLSNYLLEKNFSYTGTDCNKSLINFCKNKHVHTNTEFFVNNILLDDFNGRTWDIVTMFGLLNLKINEIDKYDFVREMIITALKVTNEVLIVDMLSSNLDKSYKKENFVNYFDPLKVIKLVFTLSPYVKLIHDYISIPQREFMLIIRKKPCK